MVAVVPGSGGWLPLGACLAVVAPRRRPRGEHQLLRLPLGQEPRDPADEGDSRMTKCCACHANHSGTAAATQEPQGVHPTPW